MSNPQHNEYIQAQATTSQAPVAMRELTAQELLAVVGGPEIRNGDMGFLTPPTASAS